ncbi:hypothetical protein V6N12_015074 [Hibiscus sabdariffa]|uniref:Uncharacterized protein n=1 Tax=Hibiscus sabdariffa TaxID=183260 RepID=A0ABR2DM15_9ROSI
MLPEYSVNGWQRIRDFHRAVGTVMMEIELTRIAAIPCAGTWSPAAIAVGRYVARILCQWMVMQEMLDGFLWFRGVGTVEMEIKITRLASIPRAGARSLATIAEELCVGPNFC